MSSHDKTTLGASPSIFHSFLTHAKFIFVWHSSKPAQKIVEVDIWPPLGRPMSPFYDFGIKFNIFGALFHQNFNVCSKVAKVCKCLKTHTFFMILAFLALLFPTKIRSRFRLIFQGPSKTTFLRLPAAFGCQKVAVLNLLGSFRQFPKSNHPSKQKRFNNKY